MSIVSNSVALGYCSQYERRKLHTPSTTTAGCLLSIRTPRDLLVPFPSEPMTMWPISTRVNKPENDDPSILEPVDEPVEGIAKQRW
jgi:hypothetical protein